MKQIITNGIVLSRTDYAEADRIVTLLTPDQGKLRLMARGVRKIKSRTASGIELFSISEIGYMQGRGELGTLISARLITHYGAIVQNIDRVQLGYALIKMLNKATEDELEGEYFELLAQSLDALNDHMIAPILINTWFQAQLLRVGGNTPNLRTDVQGEDLEVVARYDFDYDSGAFFRHAAGRYGSQHIKAMRVIFSQNALRATTRIQGLLELLPDIEPILALLRATYTHA